MPTQTADTQPLASRPVSAAEGRTVLLVDDEPHVLSALQRALRPDGYQLLLAHNGAEAAALLEKELVGAIVSDQRMPLLSGTGLLAKATALQPDAARILLTGHIEPQAMMDAINRGQVFRFMPKPWDDADLRSTLSQAFAQRELKLENRRLVTDLEKRNAELADLNQTLESRVAEQTAAVLAQRDELKNLYERLDAHYMDIMRMFAGLLEARDSYASGHSRRVATLARALAKRLDLKPATLREIDIAATLHDVGKIGIPATVMGRPERLWTEAEHQAVQMHPQIGQVLVMGVEDLKPMGILIRHHHERFNGRGYPDHLAGDQIPLGSRIIAVADAFDNLTVPRGKYEQALSAPEALAALQDRAGRSFDPAIVQLLADHLDGRSPEPVGRRELELSPSQLKAGMILSRDLNGGHGLLLIAADIPLLASQVERIQYFDQIESLGPIYVDESGSVEPSALVTAA